MDMDQKIKEMKQTAEKLERIKQQFPDLKEHSDRWRKITLQAKSANEKCTNIAFWHSCGCCSDSPYYANPYLVFEGEKIYSDPMEICIGEGSYTNNIDEDWEEILKSKEISQQAIDSARKEILQEMKEYKEHQEAIDSEDYQDYD